MSGCVGALVARVGFFGFDAGVLEWCPRDFVVVRCGSCKPTVADAIGPLESNASNRCHRHRVASSLLFAGNFAEQQSHVVRAAVARNFAVWHDVVASPACDAV